MKKKTLAFIIPSMNTGGAEKILLTAANWFAEKEYVVHIVFLKEQGKFLEQLSPSIHRWNINNGSIYFSVFQIRKIIRKINPDVIFSWMGYLNAYLSFFKPFIGKKMLWLCRESSIPSLMNKQYRFSWLYTFFYRFYNRYDRIVCQSQWMSEDLISAFGTKKEKTTVINNPVDFGVVSKKMNDTVAASAFDNTPYRLLYVGGLHSWKRPELLIDALAMLPEEYKLTMLGSGAEEHHLREKIAKKHLGNRVRIINNCTNPFPYYAASSCLILCSKFEGFPNVVTEAMAVGCPAIGYGIKGGANEVLSNYGGYIVNDADMPALIDTVRKVCETGLPDRNRISEVCREKYNLEKIMQQYEQLLNNK